MDNILNTVI